MRAMIGRARLDVDLGALVRNARAAQSRAGVPLIPMIKADAYGLGAEPVAEALESLDPYGYGIATIEEGRALRGAGITRPLIVFTPLLRDEYSSARELALTPTLGSASDIAAWCDYGGSWHLSIDTGMSRHGISWREAGSLRSLITEHMPEGAFTHFHSAELNDGTVALQEQRFREALASLPARPRVLHTDNSAAIARRGKSEWDAVRPGVFLYGVGSGAGAGIEPEALIQLRSRIVETRWIEAGETVSYDATWKAESRCRIATIPIGYADGYPRSLSNLAWAIAADGRVPVTGLVTMDMIMLDVTGSKCDIGDEVTLIGRGANGETIAAEELAGLAGMSHYELLTGLRGRLDRHYTK